MDVIANALPAVLEPWDHSTNMWLL